MKQTRDYPALTVTRKAEHALKAGHPWVYGEEITAQTETPENGALCDVLSPKGSYLGTGLYSAHSKIKVRILSKNANDRFDPAFFERRLRYAVEYGTRAIMMHDGGIIMDVKGEEKKNKSINDYLKVFNEISIECGN